MHADLQVKIDLRFLVLIVASFERERGLNYESQLVQHSLEVAVSNAFRTACDKECQMFLRAVGGDPHYLKKQRPHGDHSLARGASCRQ